MERHIRQSSVDASPEVIVRCDEREREVSRDHGPIARTYMSAGAAAVLVDVSSVPPVISTTMVRGVVYSLLLALLAASAVHASVVDLTPDNFDSVRRRQEDSQTKQRGTLISKPTPLSFAPFPPPFTGH